MTDEFAHLFALMPPAGRVRIRNLPGRWYRSFKDPKAASDALQLLLKSLPGMALILFPLSLVLIIYFRAAIISIHQSNPSLLWIVVTVFATISLIHLITLYNGYKINRRLVSLDVHRNFKILQFAVVAEIRSRTEAVYAYRLVVQAREEITPCFPIRFNWTGEGKVEVIARNPSYIVSPAERSAGSFNRYTITLDTPIQKKLERNIEYIVHVIARDDSLAVPHLGVTYYCQKYPKLNSTIAVKFLETSKPIALYREYYLGGYALGPFKNRTVSLDDDLTHRWGVKGIVNWSYCIKWDFGR